MPLPPRIRHTMEEHDGWRRGIAGFHVMPRHGFAIAGRCDEPVYHRRVAEALTFTVGVDLRGAGFGDSIKEILDALEEVLSGAAGGFGAQTRRRIGVGVGKIHAHLDGSFRSVTNRN